MNKCGFFFGYILFEISESKKVVFGFTFLASVLSTPQTREEILIKSSTRAI